MANTDTEWENSTALRAEQIAHLARFATIDMPTHIEISEQHAVVHTLYVQVEQIQSLIHKIEGYPFQWSALNSYKKFTQELTRFPTVFRTLAELEILLAKRKELIRDLVYNITFPMTRVSIEIERQKLVALAHVSRELLPLITMRNDIIRERLAKETQPENTLDVVTVEPLDLSTLV
jgi:hypothetical protein